MNKTIEIIPQINNNLEQFKTSVDVFVNQNNEYINSIKRYSNKDFSIEDELGETPEERKNRVETMLDQIDDIRKRNELILQNVELFENKIEETKEEVTQLKTQYLKDRNFIETKIQEMTEEIDNSIELMKIISVFRSSLFEP